MDDYSRYILAWQLYFTMSANDVKKSLNLAIANTGVDQVTIHHRHRLLSDNGPCHISQEPPQHMRASRWIIRGERFIKARSSDTIARCADASE